MPRIEQTALSNLIHNEEYTRKVLPFIKEEYFGNRVEQLDGVCSKQYKYGDVVEEADTETTQDD